MTSETRNATHHPKLNKRDEDKWKQRRLLAMAASMGFSIVLATVIGLAAGYFLDRLFDTSPWLTMIFLLLGIVAGFRNIYILAKRSKLL